MFWGHANWPPRTSDPKIKDSFIPQVKVLVHQFTSGLRNLEVALQNRMGTSQTGYCRTLQRYSVIQTLKNVVSSHIFLWWWIYKHTHGIKLHRTKYTIHTNEYKYNWRNLRSVDAINVNILVVTLYYRFARCYH